MNLNQTLSLVRAALNIIGSALVAKGYSDSSHWEEIAGGVVALVAVTWGFWHHSEPAPTPPPAPPTVKLG